MIPKINNVSFKGTFLRNDEETQRIVKKSETKYTIANEKKPFPQDVFMRRAKDLGAFSDKYDCDCIFSVKDKDRDRFETTAEIYDKRTGNKLDTIVEDSEQYKDGKIYPFSKLFNDIEESILKKRFIIP